MNTKRQQQNHLMSKKEKEAFIEIIQSMPWLYAPILTVIHNYASKARTLTDIACGDGHLLTLIHKKWKHLELYGIDSDAFMITHAKHPKISFSKLAVENYSQPSDIIICNLALHHFRQPVQTIRELYKLSSILIISDQLRPESVQELEQALKKRQKILGKKEHSYYAKNEKNSILEAYTKKEIESIFKKTKIPFKIFYFDNDYYQRYVAVIKNPSVKA